MIREKTRLPQMYPETPIIKLPQMSSKPLLCIYPMYVDNNHCTMVFLGGNLTGQRQRRGDGVREAGSGGEKEGKRMQTGERARPNSLNHSCKWNILK